MRIFASVIGLSLFLATVPVLADSGAVDRPDRGAHTGQAILPDASETRQRIATEFCTDIELRSNENGLPPSFMARLIWTESRFDPTAVSPVGAQGIAQFMPGTARDRRLDDPFNPRLALAASAVYLGELRTSFGNLGLAAAAYNAGEQRVRDWLAGFGTLPPETRQYVIAITGRTSDEWLKADVSYPIPPIYGAGYGAGDFAEQCLQLVLRQKAIRTPAATSHRDDATEAASTLPDKSGLQFGNFYVEREPGLARAPHFADKDRAYRTYRAVIIQALKKQVNFAGHFTVLALPCGEECSKIVIIDRLTGHIRELPSTTGSVSYSSVPQSRLLLVSAWRSAAKQCEVKAYLWEKFTPYLKASGFHGSAEFCAHGTIPEKFFELSGHQAEPDTPAIR